MLPKFPIAGRSPTISVNITDEFVCGVLYDERLPVPAGLTSLRSESILRCIVSFVAFFAFSVTCLAQDGSTGAIRGAVVDPSGRSIAGATVALMNDATGIHYAQASNIAGHFAFELLPPGITLRA